MRSENAELVVIVRSMSEKRCPKCDDVKPLDEFNVEQAKPDGRQGYCRECNRIYNDGYRAGRSRPT